MKLWNFCGCRQHRQSEENGFIDDERRQDKSREYIGILDDIGSDLASSAQLKCSETGNSVDFGHF